jgi:ribonuclease HI
MKLIINTDGGARGNPGPAGIGAVIADESGKVIASYNNYIGEATNNVAEYKALILALEKSSNGEFTAPSQISLEIRMDSELIVKQMRGQYKIKEPSLQVLAQVVFKLCKNFSSVNFVHVRREYNKLADKLVNQAIDLANGQ